MDDFCAALKSAGFAGEIDLSEATRTAYSHDASLFELMPQLVVFPKSAEDLQRLVTTVNAHRAQLPGLSITARSGGTDMSGGAINESIIVDFSHHMNSIEAISDQAARVQPGVFYRDFEKASLAAGGLMPSFPASRDIAALGGMVANNAGGEKSLEFGKVENFVTRLNVILSDGQPYVLEPLNRQQLDAKKAQNNFEGRLYQQLFSLLETHYDQIKAAKPHVSKNSTGYNLWDVWDRDRGVFDLTKLFVGSQGTLGLISNIGLRLIQPQPHSGVLVCFMKKLDNLGELINVVVATHPASFEAFDNYTLELSIKFLPYFRKTLGWGGLIKLAWQLLPDGLLLFRGIPKMILLIEFTGQTPDEVAAKIHAMRQSLKPFKLEAMEEDSTEAKAWKFRIMRRESFNILRKKVKDKHTAPFIDDLVVPPPKLTEFLPQLRAIINKYGLLATVAGHMGDGNFHVIPLMKIEQAAERAKLAPAMREVNQLVLSYGGSLSGEHNDGLIRGPWLEQMYGKPMVELFRQTKKIFDPDNIFHPHKKTDASWDFRRSHIRERF